MLLTKEVEVIPHGRSVAHYRNKGYSAKQDVPLMVKVEDLPIHSNTRVEVLCDICHQVKCTTTYNHYNLAMEKSGSYSCVNCRSIKRSRTCIDRYGVDNVSKLKECIDKMRQTSIDRYGVPSYTQTAEYRMKTNKTHQEKYGDIYVRTEEYRQKWHNTYVEKYGEDYGKKIAERATKAFYEKTGYTNPLKSPEVRRKIAQTMYNNTSVRTSKQQRYICGLYNGILNYPISYYNVDIYLSNDNLVVEYDGGGHMLNVEMGKFTIKEHRRREFVRDSAIRKEGCKQMRIISNKDRLPTDDILLQMLDSARKYFHDYPQHFWIEFNIDTSTVRNAEHKDGVFYDFKKLRLIGDGVA